MFHQSVFAWMLGVSAATGAQAQSPRAELDAVYNAQYLEIEKRLADVKRIDGDMLDMRKHVPALEGSANLRKQQIQSLRLRHPSIVVADNASAQGIYTALFNLRGKAREGLTPLLAAVRLYEHRERCTSIRSAKVMRSRIERSPEFLKQSLGERVETGVLFDALADDVGTRGPCQATDYLPEDPPTEDGLARTEQRYKDGLARLERIRKLTQRP